jgi:hypothetical protein
MSVGHRKCCINLLLSPSHVAYALHIVWSDKYSTRVATPFWKHAQENSPVLHFTFLYTNRIIKYWQKWKKWQFDWSSVFVVPTTWSYYIHFFSGVGLRPLGTAATSGLLYKPQMIDEGDCGAIGGMNIGMGNRSTRRKPAPAPLCPPQILHDQTRARTRAAAVGSQLLTAWAMAQPYTTYKWIWWNRKGAVP